MESSNYTHSQRLISTTVNDTASVSDWPLLTRVFSVSRIVTYVRSLENGGVTLSKNSMAVQLMVVSSHYAFLRLGQVILSIIKSVTKR